MVFCGIMNKFKTDPHYTLRDVRVINKKRSTEIVGLWSWFVKIISVSAVQIKSAKDEDSF